MICKKCNAEWEEDQTVCPQCGWDNENPETAEKKGKKARRKKLRKSAKWSLKKKIFAVLAGLLAVLLLTQYLYFALRKGESSCKNDYTYSAFWANARKDAVVATMGDDELTNEMLQMFYWMQVYDFINYYGSYVSYMGLDTKTHLDEQIYNEKTGMTWEQYFLEDAFYTWQHYQSIVNAAEEANYQLPEEYREHLDGLKGTLQADAEKNGYDSLDELLQRDLGCTATFESYYKYMEYFFIGNLYFEEMTKELTASEEEIEAYFKEYEEDLKGLSPSVTKTSGKLIDVRHILIQPKNGTKDEQGNTVYSEEAWEACRVKAQEIYDQWLAGDMTEESFGELANEKSEDKSGNVTDGGIYTYVAQGDMVKEFDAWCFDEGRQPGDHGLVKTQYGYHIMYFVEGDEGWIRYCEDGVTSRKAEELMEAMAAENPIEVDYRKIYLNNPELLDS